MALPPKFSAHQILTTSLSASHSTSPHTLEIYLDYVCPFSAKIFKTLDELVIPLLQKSFREPGVRIIFRQQIQPWHPSSTLVHEAGVAVSRLAPGKFWEFSKVLFEHQKEYFDVNVVHEPRNETYKRLAKLAGGIDGIDEHKILELLVVSDKPDNDGGLNIGNKVTDDLKYLVKMNRVTGVHVTPTVVFNGVEERSISSGWTGKQWEEWAGKNLV
jgi:protein-disulfide isomerase